MKTIMQIAKECGIHYETVYRIVTQEQITTMQGATKIKLTNTQAEHIEHVLHNKGYFTFLTLESKMNDHAK